MDFAAAIVRRCLSILQRLAMVSEEVQNVLELAIS
jgi:hypothetical protein